MYDAAREAVGGAVIQGIRKMEVEKGEAKRRKESEGRVEGGGERRKEDEGKGEGGGERRKEDEGRGEDRKEEGEQGKGRDGGVEVSGSASAGQGDAAEGRRRVAGGRRAARMTWGVNRINETESWRSCVVRRVRPRRSLLMMGCQDAVHLGRETRHRLLCFLSSPTIKL